MAMAFCLRMVILQYLVLEALAMEAMVVMGDTLALGKGTKQVWYTPISRLRAHLVLDL